MNSMKKYTFHIVDSDGYLIMTITSALSADNDAARESIMPAFLAVKADRDGEAFLAGGY